MNGHEWCLIVRPWKLEWSVTQAIKTLAVYMTIYKNHHSTMVYELLLLLPPFNVPSLLDSISYHQEFENLVVILMDSYYVGFLDSEEPHFLESCSLCRKTLSINSDIFMYRYLIRCLRSKQINKQLNHWILISLKKFKL